MTTPTTASPAALVASALRCGIEPMANGHYDAMTPERSRIFRTWPAAAKWMAKQGYSPKGERIAAAKALDWGMIHKVVADDVLDAEADAAQQFQHLLALLGP